MAGVLTFRGGPKAPPALCLPDEIGWRLWSPVPGAGTLSSQPLAPDRLADAPAGSRIGLPARHLLAFPLWLQTVDAALFRELARVQLERRGLLRDGAAAWDHLLVCQEEGRSLVAVFLVQADLPPALLAFRPGAYEAAARCRPLPENAWVVWRELGGLAVAATRQSRPVCLHFFPETLSVAEAAGELGALRRLLAWEGVLAEGTGCLLWGDFAADDTAAAAGAFGTAVRQEPLPMPQPPPSQPLSLTPPAVGAEGRRHQQSRRQRSLFLYAGAAYAVLVLAVAAGLAWQQAQARKLAAGLKADAPAVERLSAAAAAWRAVAPAIDSSYYPLECLRACVQALPPEVRLTEYDHSPGKVLLVGEGKDAASIFHFLDAIKADPFLKQWTWAMPQPLLLPNNRAQFHLEGTREPSAAK